MGARKVDVSSAGGWRMLYVVRESEISGGRWGVILSVMSVVVMGRV